MQKLYYPLTTVVFAAFIFLSDVCAGELQFVHENIDVSLFPPDTVEVKGEYFFTSSDGKPCKQMVIYPFPLDHKAEFPSYIVIKKSDSTQEIAFSRLEKGISFPVDVPQADTAVITVTYRQRFSNKTGCYILTTTAFWGRPLINSRYTLSVPVNITINYISYDCDTVYTKGNSRVYSFFRKKFMPDRDFIFMW